MPQTSFKVKQNVIWLLLNLYTANSDTCRHNIHTDNNTYTWENVHDATVISV